MKEDEQQKLQIGGSRLASVRDNITRVSTSRTQIHMQYESASLLAQRQLSQTCFGENKTSLKLTAAQYFRNINCRQLLLTACCVVLFCLRAKHAFHAVCALPFLLYTAV